MPDDRYGEEVPVQFEYCRSYEHPHYVYGHVTRAEAEAALGSVDVPPDACLTHLWARWVPDSTGEYSCRLYTCGPGRGAFKVTEMEWCEEYDPPLGGDDACASGGAGEIDEETECS